MHAVVAKGLFTGVCYPELNDRIIAHHAEYDEKLIAVDTCPINVGTDENPDYGSPDPTTASTTKAEARRQIDKIAGDIRQSYASGGFGISEEYQRTYVEAKRFLEDTTQIVPASVQCWADVKFEGKAVAAATNIVQTGDVVNSVLDTVRAIRLKGKEAVNSCPVADTINDILTNEEEAFIESVKNDVIIELNKLMAPS